MDKSCDAANGIEQYLTNILQKTLEIKILLDRKTLFNVVIIKVSTTETRLLIYTMDA